MALKATFSNRANFYASVRQRASGVFGTSISQAQVSGVEAILDEGAKRGTLLKHMAYILATSYHESARTMQAVREALAKTDNGAVAVLEKAWKAGTLPWVKTPYWRKDADGKAWFGRGLVQITHKANYQKLGLLIGVDLAKDPSRRWIWILPFRSSSPAWRLAASRARRSKITISCCSRSRHRPDSTTCTRGGS